VSNILRNAVRLKHHSSTFMPRTHATKATMTKNALSVNFGRRFHKNLKRTYSIDGKAAYIAVHGVLSLEPIRPKDSITICFALDLSLKRVPWSGAKSLSLLVERDEGHSSLGCNDVYGNLGWVVAVLGGPWHGS
jgi:hypothetical protein